MGARRHRVGSGTPRVNDICGWCEGGARLRMSRPRSRQHACSSAALRRMLRQRFMPAAGPEDISHRADSRAGRRDPEQCAVRTSNDPRARSAAAGDFDCRDSEGIPAGVEAGARPRHHGRNDSRHIAAAAAYGPGRLPRQREGAGSPRDLAGASGQQRCDEAGHLLRDSESAGHGVRAQGNCNRQGARSGRSPRPAALSRLFLSATWCSSATPRDARHRS